MPGTTDTGNHIDDGTTPITLPFSYTLYDQTFTAANVDSNGTFQFVTPCLDLHEHLPARHNPHVSDLPVLGRPAHRCANRLRGFPWWNLRYFHLGIGHCAQPDLQYRMAHRLLRQRRYDG